MFSKKNVPIIIVVAMLTAAGVLSIFIPCIVNNNYYALISLFVFSICFLFPLTCKAFNFALSYDKDEALLYDSNEQSSLDVLKMLAWAITGILVVIGYSTPFLLWSVNEMQLINMIFTMCGGTVLIIAGIVFIKLLIFS